MGYKPTSRIDGTLYELIVRYGWGMYGDAEPLHQNPPQTIDGFVDMLMVIDGREPAAATRHDRRFVAAIVNDWIFDPAGRGAKSGLPVTDRL